MPPKPRTVDEYLARVSDEHRTALEKLRRAIKSAAPTAEECISYDMPAYRLGGRYLMGFGAAAKHCAFHIGAHPLSAHNAELGGYATSKGSIRFSPSKPLPAALVKKLVKTRVAERAPRESKAPAKRTTRAT